MHLAEDPKIWYGEDRVTYLSVLVNVLLFQNGLISMAFTEHSSSTLTLSGDQCSLLAAKCSQDHCLNGIAMEPLSFSLLALYWDTLRPGVGSAELMRRLTLCFPLFLSLVALCKVTGACGSLSYLLEIKCFTMYCQPASKWLFEYETIWEPWQENTYIWGLLALYSLWYWVEEKYLKTIPLELVVLWWYPEIAPHTLKLLSFSPIYKNMLLCLYSTNYMEILFL